MQVNFRSLNKLLLNAADVCQFSNPVMLFDQAEWYQSEKIDVFNPNFFSVYDAGVCLFFCVKILPQVNNFCIIFLLSVILCISTTIQRIVMWNAFKELINALLSIICYEKHASRKQCIYVFCLFIWTVNALWLRTVTLQALRRFMLMYVLNVCITTQWRNVFNLCTATGPSSFIDIHYINTQYCERIMICLQINSHVPKLSHL